MHQTTKQNMDLTLQLTPKVVSLIFEGRLRNAHGSCEPEYCCLLLSSHSGFPEISNNSEQKRMVKSQKTDQVGGETDRSDQELCQPLPTTTNNQRKSVIVG